MNTLPPLARVMPASLSRLAAPATTRALPATWAMAPLLSRLRLPERVPAPSSRSRLLTRLTLRAVVIDTAPVRLLVLLVSVMSGLVPLLARVVVPATESTVPLD